jgi:hypothetical protein
VSCCCGACRWPCWLSDAAVPGSREDFMHIFP